MTAFVDVELIEGLALPYVAGAESALADPALDPLFQDSWEWLVAGFPGLTLQPLFDTMPVEQIADLVDAIRVGGEEPPDPFRWFTLPCDDAIADALVAALQGLPLFDYAGKRFRHHPAGLVSYGTNPDVPLTFHLQPAPHGVDAVYAWDVAGGAGEGARVADIESGWFLGHEELISARVHPLSVTSALFVDHGTSVAGIIVGADNGVGTIGVVPEARLDLVSDIRADEQNLAAAILLSVGQLTRGDVLLIEGAQEFFAHPPDTAGAPDIVSEFDPPVQRAIRFAVKRGITVIEPAGNGGVNHDAFPFLAHTRPESPSFSGAIVVGAGEADLSGNWARTFSSYGSRVDCFAAGSRIRAPTTGAPNAYTTTFGGTSGASAIVAGLAAALQSMTRAANNNAVLAPEDIRRLFRSAQLGTLPADALGARIGSMPDLRRIVQAQGLPRVLPVAAARIVGDALLVVHLDAENRMVRRHFTFFTGWGQPVPSPAPNDEFELTAAQPALLATEETEPIARLRYDAFFSGPLGVHHMWWDSLGQSGDVSQAIAGFTVAAQGHALGAVFALPELLVLAAISPEARLVVLTGDPQALLAGTSPPLVLDPVARYRRMAGPVVMSRAAGLADIVMIEDGGGLVWYQGNLLATVGTGWTGAITEPSSVSFDPGVRPALLAVGEGLLAAAVGTEGWLRVAALDPAAGVIEEPVVVDVGVTIDTGGPVALVAAGDSVVLLGVDTDGILRAATRPVTGGEWSALLTVFSSMRVSPLGGVVAVPSDLGVMALTVGMDGIVQSALSPDGVLWSPLLPLP
jgi:subtilisin family serine protease